MAMHEYPVAPTDEPQKGWIVLHDHRYGATPWTVRYGRAYIVHAAFAVDTDAYEFIARQISKGKGSL